ncbi:ATP-binding protein [Enterococcus songbeiensis]
MENKPSNKWLTIGLLSVAVLTLLGIILTITSYHNTREQAMKLNKNQLTKINDYATKVWSLSIQNYSDILENYSLDFFNEDQLTQLPKKNRLINDFQPANQALEGIYLLDTEGNLLEGYSYTDNRLEKIAQLPAFIQKDSYFEDALAGNIIQNGKEFFANNASYINLYQPVTNHDKSVHATLVVPLNLEKLYQNEILPEDNDYYGYTMIKNEDFRVLVHPVEEQIGWDIIQDRRKKFPDLDLSDLEHLQEVQATHDHGTLSYYSYWWTEDKPRKTLKISAYQWVTIGKARWIVASNSDVNQRSGITLQEILILLGLFFLLLALIALTLLNLRSYAKRNQAYVENMRLQEKQKLLAERYETEKIFQQESKLETVGLLTTSIVHDMNNFLTPLLGNIQLLLAEHQEDEVLQEDLKEIYQAAKKGQQLAGNVLRFSKSDTRPRTNLDLKNVVTEAVQTMHVLIPQTVNLQLSAEEVGESFFEADDLQVLLYNLITNAFQAAGNNAVIQVNLTPANQKQTKQFQQHSATLQKKKFAVLVVQDNGPGISKAIESKIFTPFYTTKSEDGGTGLGLFVVASIIKKHDWLLDLESSEKGTCFTIAIPLI